MAQNKKKVKSNSNKSNPLRNIKKGHIILGVFTVIFALIIILFIMIVQVDNKIDRRIGERSETEGAIEGKVYFTEKNLFFSGTNDQCNSFCVNKCAEGDEYDGYDGKYKINDRVCSCSCYKLVK